MAQKLTACFGLGSGHKTTSSRNQQLKSDFFEGNSYELVLSGQDKSTETSPLSFVVIDLFLSPGGEILTEFIEQM